MKDESENFPDIRSKDYRGAYRTAQEESQVFMRAFYRARFVALSGMVISALKCIFEVRSGPFARDGLFSAPEFAYGLLAFLSFIAWRIALLAESALSGGHPGALFYGVAAHRFYNMWLGLVCVLNGRRFFEFVEPRSTLLAYAVWFIVALVFFRILSLRMLKEMVVWFHSPNGLHLFPLNERYDMNRGSVAFFLCFMSLYASICYCIHLYS